MLSVRARVLRGRVHIAYIEDGNDEICFSLVNLTFLFSSNCCFHPSRITRTPPAGTPLAGWPGRYEILWTSRPPIPDDMFLPTQVNSKWCVLLFCLRTLSHHPSYSCWWIVGYGQFPICHRANIPSWSQMAGPLVQRWVMGFRRHAIHQTARPMRLSMDWRTCCGEGKMMAILEPYIEVRALWNPTTDKGVFFQTT